MLNFDNIQQELDQALQEREELKVRLTEVERLEHRLSPLLSNPKGEDYRMARVTPKRFYLVKIP